jgi:predicted ATPase/DNA-binding SARP family transcriptional activator
MEFRILGPLEVRDDERTLPLVGARQRALLAMLLLSPNRVVSSDRMIDQLWDGRPPATATTTLQNHIMRLRRLLEPEHAPGAPYERIVTEASGYVLRLEPDQLDLFRFERLVADGRAALADGRADVAGRTLREALDLWRGPALADLAAELPMQTEAARLDELRLAALELRVDADLALGRHAELVGELESLVTENPLRERFSAQLMLALYRSRRQAEALELYRQTRTRLVDELGIDPSAELQELERAILRQDASLDVERRERLPTGTVTFLFSDIEGSTQLLRQLGDAYPALLAEHRRLLREVIAAHAGVEFDSQGDAFFAVFTRASDAVAAAQAIQNALGDGPVRVRIGVHTGEPTLTEEGYVGIDLHRAARIAAAGHGGQVLLSHATRDLVEADGRDLGLHRLKDITDPVRLYQLGQADFARLTTLSQTNVPVPANPLIGRGREIASVSDLLDDGRVRLVTLTGPGGSGKSRLALEIGHLLLADFPDGAFLVPLAPLRDPELVLPTIAQTLSVTEVPGEPLDQTLAAALHDRKLLLIVDNFEHVLDAATAVSGLLAACPQLQVLATSRAPLRLLGEHELPVPPLALPETDAAVDLDVVVRSPAVSLFVVRSQAVKPDFRATDANAQALAEICTRLDGLPLAIELAAAHTKLLPPATMLRRLTDSLDLLADGPRDLPTRQQTLRNTLDWSYRLLSEREQRLFARLGVFAGGFTLESAEAVCSDDVGHFLADFSSLLGSNLIARDQSSPAQQRFTMLETIHTYALERLETGGDTEKLRDQHAEHFLAFAETAEAKLRGPAQRTWLEHLEAEHDNLRRGLDWCSAAGASAERSVVGLRLAGALGLFWYIRSHVREGCAWLERALAADPGAAPGASANALKALGLLTSSAGDPAAAQALLERSVTLYRAAGDRDGLARSLNNLGIAARTKGDTGRAREHFTESLALRRELGDPQGLASQTCNLGVLELDEGNLTAARALFEESHSLARELGNQMTIVITLSNLGAVALEQEDLEFARAVLEEGLVLSHELGYREYVAECLEGLASLAIRCGEPERGVGLAGAGAALREVIGVPLAGTERERLHRQLAVARRQLGERAFAEAYAAGSALKREEALAVATASSRATSRDLLFALPRGHRVAQSAGSRAAADFPDEGP